MIFEGIAQRFVQRAASQLASRFTELGSLAVDQVKESGDEMTRAGCRYHLSAEGATGVAAGVTIPSTAASWMLYNPIANNVTAWIDRIAAVNNSGTGGATGGAIWVCLVPPKFAPSSIATVSTANVTIQNANPASTKQSNLVCTSGVTLQNAAVGNWFPVASSTSATAVLLNGYLIDSGWDIRGKIAIPPGCGLAMYVVMAIANSPVFVPLFSWREYASDTE
jgi:hypothetical protein